MDARTRRRLDLLALGAAVLALAAGAAAWSRLPAEMAIHFTATGRPDNYVPRAVGVAVIPAVTVVTALVFRWAFRADPPENARVPLAVAGATYALLVGLQLLVVGWNLGYRPPFSAVLAGIGLWAVAMVAYALWVDV